MTASPVLSTGSVEPSAPAMSKRQVLEALSGLLLGMFVSILAGTVVSTSLPRIIGDLGGDQAAFTWVVTSTLLATAVSTPLWGKFADLFSRKLLIQLSLGIFVLGSALAGFSQDTNTLITFRVLQGLGAGGLAALSQIIMADIISPRERGRYMGLFGGVMALGTIGGPLIGGLITDSIGWRWNFFVAVPFAVVAIILLQKTLRLPVRSIGKVSIDYFGAILLASGVSLLMIWVTMAGTQFEWLSGTSLIMAGSAVALLVACVIVELNVKNPIIPLSLFKDRTFTLSVIASIAVGVAMFGTSVFLSQYMQLARGATPTQSGLLTLPMIGGMLIASTVIGQLVSRFGKWKAWLVTGSVLMIAGMFLMGTLEYDTNYVLVSIYMFLLGAGVGMLMQNLVLIVQNSIAPQLLGVATSTVTFFRSLGGTIGVSVMGAVLGSSVMSMMLERSGELRAALAALGKPGRAIGEKLASGTLPNVHELPASVRIIVESVYGEAVAGIFLVAAPLAIVTLIAVIFLPNKPLSTMTAVEKLAKETVKTSPTTGAVAVVAGIGVERLDEPGASESHATGSPLPEQVAPEAAASESARTKPAGGSR